MKNRALHRLFFLSGLITLLLWTSACQAKNSLWQVRAADHTLYLLGSLHVLKKESYPLPPFIEEVYAASGAVVFEADLDEMDTPPMQQKILSYGKLPAGQTLQQQLSPETWQRLTAKTLSLNIKTESIQPLRPWLCALTLTVTDLERLGFLPQYGLDEYFYRRAQKDGKKIIPLESVDFQLSLFYSQSKKEQEDFLLQTLDDLQMSKEMADDLETAWKTGNEAMLAGMVAQSFAGYAPLYKRLVLDRNRNWLPALEKMIKQEQVTLVVVGAGHLVGPGSVVDLLRRKGYPVVQR
ncbi:MAG: hypothetical protein BM485_05920 [Desulfobulbaceae bacterium DB1]|nr:MAG: hypothetical protein BM485_05920 [Desulfobulbaceae bacterium DB1]